jgi:hypothetical protein
MKESRLWAWVNANRPLWLSIERIEVLHPPGLADCFWTDTRTRISGWLELKQCEPGDHEYKAGRIPKIRPEQPMFLRRQAENGVPSGLLLRVTGIGFHLWVATPERGWSNFMRSTDAIDNSIFMKDPTLDTIMMHLLP